MVEHNKLKLNVQKNGNGSLSFSDHCCFYCFSFKLCYLSVRCLSIYYRSWSLFSYNRWKKGNYLYIYLSIYLIHPSIHLSTMWPLLVMNWWRFQYIHRFIFHFKWPCRWHLVYFYGGSNKYYIWSLHRYTSFPSWFKIDGKMSTDFVCVLYNSNNNNTT